MKDEILYNPTRICYKGKCLKLSEWAKERGLTREGLRARVNAGWSIPECLGYSKRASYKRGNKNAQKITIPYKGKDMSIREFAQAVGLTENQVRYQLNTQVWDPATPQGKALSKTVGRKPNVYWIEGDYLTIAEISDRYGLSRATVYARLCKGLSSKDVIAPRGIAIFLNGERLTLKELSKRYNKAYPTLCARYRRGMRGEALIK